jgi:hypothetical protein
LIEALSIFRRSDSGGTNHCTEEKYVVGQAPKTDDTTTNCGTTVSHVDVAWIRRVTPDADTNPLSLAD